MSDATSTLTAKVWNLAGVMNNAGVGAGDYVEQVTYLLFLKLDAERAEDGEPSLVPPACQWSALAPLHGAALSRAYGEARWKCWRRSRALSAPSMPAPVTASRSRRICTGWCA